MYGQGHRGKPRFRGSYRYLGDGQQRALRCAAREPRRAVRAVRHGIGRRRPVLVQGHQARELPHPPRRPRGEAVAAARPALLAARACTLYVPKGRLGSFDHVSRNHGAEILISGPTADLDRTDSALYLRGDPYEKSDAVFGVKKSLVIDLEKVDKKTAEEYKVPEGSWLLKQDFILVTEKESLELRDRLATEALEKLGLNLKLVDHLPVPELD